LAESSHSEPLDFNDLSDRYREKRTLDVTAVTFPRKHFKKPL